MDLSIIIPCHNLEHYIKPLLLSFQIIDYTDIEVEFIFVLDACTDKTRGQIEQYMPLVDKPYYIYECDYHSCGLARNFGFEHSQGNYIWFVDGDDWIINPRVLNDTIIKMAEDNIPIIQIPFVSNFYNQKFYSMVWQYIYSRELICDIKFPEIQPEEDIHFMKLVLNKLDTNEIDSYTIPSYFYNYNRPGSNTTIDRQKNSEKKI